MSQVPAWYERQFSFTFPAEQFPNLCSRLRGTPARIEELLDNASREKLTNKPEGKWSVQEHVGHLLNLESLWRKRVEDFFDQTCETLSVTDLSNRQTDDANYNSRPTAEILTEFRAERQRLLDRLNTLGRESFELTRLHPRLKQPMRLVDHLFFVAEHDDHHVAKMWEMLHNS